MSSAYVPLTLPCLGLPGLATRSERVSERAPCGNTCLHVHIYTSTNTGGWVAPTNCPHPQHTSVSAWGKPHSPVGGGWISETSDRGDTQSPRFLLGGTTQSQDARIYLSIFIQSNTTTCGCWPKGAQGLSTEYVRGAPLYPCVGMHVWTGEGRRSRLQGED